MEPQAQTAPEAGGHSEGSPTQRGETRSNVFVVATLYSDGGSSPVRLRNISSSGALLEGAVLPLAGARIQLCRGSLRTTGQIVWNKDGRVGVRFDSTIRVVEWLPKGFRASNQQQVDEMVFQLRSGAPFAASMPALPSPSLTLEQQLAAVQQMLDFAADQLASDASIARSCAGPLQRIDEAGQLLGSLIARLGKGGR